VLDERLPRPPVPLCVRKLIEEQSRRAASSSDDITGHRKREINRAGAGAFRSNYVNGWRRGTDDTDEYRIRSSNVTSAGYQHVVLRRPPLGAQMLDTPCRMGHRAQGRIGMKRGQQSNAPDAGFVPDLAAVIADPSIMQSAPPAVQAELYRQILRLEADVRVHFLSSLAPRESSEASEEVLTMAEAAALLRISKDTLYRKWRQLPGAYKDSLDGQIKFRRRSLDRYLQQR
jgi:Helix-turn-helix domain